MSAADAGTLSWTKNEYWARISRGLEKVAQRQSREPLTFDDTRRVWLQPSLAGKHSHVGLLQNQYGAVDVTDCGLAIRPLLLEGTFLLGLRFGGEIDGKRFTFGFAPAVNPGRSIAFEPGAVAVTTSLQGHTRIECRVFLPATFPFVFIDVEADGIAVEPHVMWIPGDREIAPHGDFVWVRPASLDAEDPTLTRNDSVLPDPSRPSDRPRAGLGIALVEPDEPVRVVRTGTFTACESVTLADRPVPGNEIEVMTLSMSPSTHAGRLTYVVGVAENGEQFAAELVRWRSLSERDAERHYWPSLAERIEVSCGVAAIEHQVPFSVHNSLFSRTLTGDGRTIFVHGRRDRGYADVAHLHQSYMMHFAALAAGEYESVRSEILAYAALQDASGDVARAPRPGGGWHPYAGTYSNAHFMMAAHRYIAWSGDESILGEHVQGKLDGQTVSLLDRLVRAGEWLASMRVDGVVAPCGWADGWPPDVVAQCQTSCASVIGLRELAELCGHARRAADSARFHQASAELERRTAEVFYDLRTGIFAEHLMRSGEVAAGDPNDFCTHTQIWAALAGIAPDNRGLELAYERCFRTGLQVTTESSFAKDYITRSTDGQADFDAGFTATWLLAAWPELTHLLALALARRGNPDRALQAIRAQLPATINRGNAFAPAFYYPEKYIYPFDLPWLCTWAGDPTLIEALLAGFFGVRPGLDQMTVDPRLPSGWAERGVSARFVWRGASVDLRLSGLGGKVASMTVNGVDAIPGAPFDLDALSRGKRLPNEG